MSRDCKENKIIGQAYEQITEQIDSNLVTKLIGAMGGVSAVQQVKQDTDALNDAVQIASKQLGTGYIGRDVVIAVVQRIQPGGVDPAGTQQPYQQ